MKKLITLSITAAILLTAGQAYAFGSGGDRYKLANTPMVAEALTNLSVAR